MKSSLSVLDEARPEAEEPGPRKTFFATLKRLLREPLFHFLLLGSLL
jgi:hypothetical protein